MSLSKQREPWLGRIVFFLSPVLAGGLVATLNYFSFFSLFSHFEVFKVMETSPWLGSLLHGFIGLVGAGLMLTGGYFAIKAILKTAKSNQKIQQPATRELDTQEQTSTQNPNPLLGRAWGKPAPTTAETPPPKSPKKAQTTKTKNPTDLLSRLPARKKLLEIKPPPEQIVTAGTRPTVKRKMMKRHSDKNSMFSSKYKKHIKTTLILTSNTFNKTSTPQIEKNSTFETLELVDYDSAHPLHKGFSADLDLANKALLKKLIFSNCKLDEELTDKLLKLLKTNTSLRTLILSNCTLNLNFLKQLSSLDQESLSLSKLELQNPEFIGIEKSSQFLKPFRVVFEKNHPNTKLVIDTEYSDGQRFSV